MILKPLIRRGDFKIGGAVYIPYSVKKITAGGFVR
jgi:hypothetical protein